MTGIFPQIPIIFLHDYNALVPITVTKLIVIKETDITGDLLKVGPFYMQGYLVIKVKRQIATLGPTVYRDYLC